MEIIRFEALKWTTLAMFVVSVILIFVHPIAATILMFSIVCLWSRVPALISAFTKDLEVIDFFTVYVALSMGGWVGGLFGAANMLFSRLYGPLEWPWYTVKDAISLFICGLATPIVYTWTGGNILITMYSFTAIRYASYLILTVFLEPGALMLEIGICSVSVFVAILSNTITVSIFGAVISSILDTGLQVNLTLIGFIIAILGLAFFSKLLLAMGQNKAELMKGRKWLQALFSFFFSKREAKTVMVYDPAKGLREEKI